MGKSSSEQSSAFIWGFELDQGKIHGQHNKGDQKHGLLDLRPHCDI